ncbi:MAG: hypothetical protein IJT40_04405 [Firmicutes bacterium]|nr:hypothetical protein [Bacillota bacterium]
MGFLKNLVAKAQEADARAKAEEAQKKAEMDQMLGGMGKLGKALKFVSDHVDTEEKDPFDEI